MVCLFSSGHANGSATFRLGGRACARQVKLLLSCVLSILRYCKMQRTACVRTRPCKVQVGTALPSGRLCKLLLLPCDFPSLPCPDERPGMGPPPAPPRTPVGPYWSGFIHSSSLLCRAMSWIQLLRACCQLPCPQRPCGSWWPSWSSWGSPAPRACSSCSVGPSQATNTRCPWLSCWRSVPRAAPQDRRGQCLLGTVGTHACISTIQAYQRRQQPTAMPSQQHVPY
jgi:hypothetical protein